MIVQLNISDVILQPELNAAKITITPIFSSGVPDVNKQYVDEGLALKVDKIENYSLIHDTEINKLSEYPELTGNPNKFISDDGTVKEITSSIGVVGTDFYASVEPSTLLEGAYQLKQTIDPTETEMTIIAGGGAIVSGAKFIDENPAQAFQMGTVGFDYWRKISSLAGKARKGLRFFLFDTSDNSEIDIFDPLWSSPIEVTDFAERQISYSVPDVNPAATQHYGVEFLFTATGSNKTLTYIVGDGRGWFMRLPLPIDHDKLTNKNGNAAVQHVDTTVTKATLNAADMVAIKDSVTGKVVLTPKSNLQTDLTTVNLEITNLQNEKQNTLVSGQNIKTVNGISILGAGNIIIEGGSGTPIEKATEFSFTDDSDYLTGKVVSDFMLQNSDSVVLNGYYTNSYLSATGEVISSANWRTDAYFIAVTEGATYKYRGSTAPSSGVAKCVIGYDDAGLFVSILVGTGDYTSSDATFIIPVGVAKIKCCGFYQFLPTVSGVSMQIKKALINTRLKKYIRRKFNAVGMSIWASDGTLKGYQTLIKEQFSFDGYTNYSYSGYSLGATTSGDASSIAVAKVPSFTGGSTDVWTVDTITNDFKRNIPIGTITDYNNNTGATTYYGALRILKEKIASLSPLGFVICSNALRRNNAGYTSTSSNTAGHTLVDYEKALMTIASLNSWYFVDQFRLSGITDDTLSITTSDGLHLTNFGYTIAVNVWLSAFNIIYYKDNKA